ncbi:MAG: AAA family ATPase [Alphaproteobacteria bacterium]|nr:AAA family ATPase [Alphaproteobacteria bacterium]
MAIQTESEMKITIPEFCLVVLVGPECSGRSTFARRHFKPTEVISLDECRGIVADGENGVEAGEDAERLSYFIAETRLKRRKLAVIDAANVYKEGRARLVRLARENNARAVAIVIDPGEEFCLMRNFERGLPMDAHDVRNQIRALQGAAKKLDKEGYRDVYELRSCEAIEASRIERSPMRSDRRMERGPFDIIGDVHGCVDELLEMFAKLGYGVSLHGKGVDRRVNSIVPEGRRALFVGDLVDRGPATPDVLRIVMHMVAQGHAICVAGNHDVKLLRYLKGRDVKLNHGLDLTVSQLDAEPPAFKGKVKSFIEGLVSHAWLEGGDLAIAHAGIKDYMLGRASGAVRQFCLYGETSGETDEFGLPIRYNWAAEYRGATTVVYGHTPVPEAEWLNNTLCIDTGCVFGGKLTALRWPEREIVSVPARKMYAKPIRPLAHPPNRPGVIG